MNGSERMSQIRYEEQNRESLSNGSTEEERRDLRSRMKIFRLTEAGILKLLKKHLVMPLDVTIKKVYLNEMWDEFVVVLQSKSFDKVPEGQAPPEVNGGVALRL